MEKGNMAIYRSTTYIPPLVRRANNLASQMGYSISCSNQVGRLMQFLVSQYQSGVIGEIGAGCGCEAAWMISALAPGTSFFAVEADPALAAVARALFESYPNVRILQGDWQSLLRYRPFGLLCTRVQCIPPESYELLFQAIRPGGVIALGGLQPQEELPVEVQSNEPDPVRDYWLNDPRLLATELLVSPSEAVIMASRVG